MTESDRLDVELLEKVIAVHTRDPDCASVLQRLLRDPEGFAQVMSDVEKWLDETKEDEPKEQETTGLPDDGHDLYTRAVNSAPLYRLLREKPRFSGAGLEQLAVLLQFADVTPVYTDSVFASQDAVFLRILGPASELEPPPADELAERLFREDLTKLIQLDTEWEAIAEALHQVAQHEEWHQQLKQIEANLERGTSVGPATGETLAEHARQVLEQIQAKDEEDESGRPRRLFLDSPRFSSVLAVEVKLYWRIREQLPSGDDLKWGEAFGAPTVEQKSSRVAHDCDIETLPAEEWHRIRRCFQVRFEAAKHFVHLREFAKISVLRHGWPKLAGLLLDDRRRFEQLEVRFRGTGSSVDEAEVTREWRPYLDDQGNETVKKLKHLLELRPLFSDIPDARARDYMLAAQAAIPTPAVVAEAILPEPEVTAPIPRPEVEVPVPEFVPPIGVGEMERIFYEDLLVSIDRIAEEGWYQVTVTAPDGSKEPAAIELEWRDEASVEKLLGFQFDALSGYRAGVPVYRDLRPMRPAATLKSVGQMIYEKTFPEGLVRDLLLDGLKRPDRIRVVLELKAPELMLIPWESLYVAPLRRFLALDLKYSLVRRPVESVGLNPRSITYPLRLLVVLASPVDAPPLDTERELRILKGELKSAMQKGRVDLRPLEHATPDKLQREMRTFRPHIFHFMGHGTFQKNGEGDEGTGFIILEDNDDDRRTELFSAEKLNTFLRDSNVSLAVLNACDTGVTSINSAITGVAGTLVSADVPAAIATMRAIPDEAAVLFARKLYSAFVDGYPIEASVVEARKALNAKEQDWSAYALFAGREIDLATLALEPRRTIEDLEER